MMQPRFDKRVGSTPYSLVEQARFRAAFDFMRLRADVGEVGEAIAEWWQEFSTADDLRRQDLLDQVREEQKPAARTRVRVRQSAGAGAGDAQRSSPAPQPRGDAGEYEARNEADEAGDEGGPAVPPDGEAAPRKRRRRRKPRGGGGEGGSEGSSGASEAGGGGHDA